MGQQGQADEAVHGRGEVILLVDDDLDLRTMIATMLQSLGYKVLESTTAKNALEILQEKPEVDLLLTDVVLSDGASGRALADRTKEKYPDLPVLFMTGYTEDAAIRQGSVDGDVQLLQKPFRRSDLARAVHRILGHR